MHKAYEWVGNHRRDLYPVFASQFIETGNGLISARIEKLSESSWRVSDYGACRTVRFDGCSLYPDLRQARRLFGG